MLQKKTISYYLLDNIDTTFAFNMITSADVKAKINQLKPKSSSGHDQLSTYLLKKIAHTIAEPLTLAINQSLVTGIFPDSLKIAEVIPLFKKDDKHDMENYRPISLLPALSKVYEKTVYKQLFGYFTQNNLIYTSQYGFRNKHSTENASIELVDRITQYMEDGKILISVFLDLSKAFDTLDHYILIKK